MTISAYGSGVSAAKGNRHRGMATAIDSDKQSNGGGSNNDGIKHDGETAMT